MSSSDSLHPKAKPTILSGPVDQASPVVQDTAGTRRERRRPVRSMAHRLALEPRIVFDGAAPVVGLDLLLDQDAEQQEAAEPSSETATAQAPSGFVFVDAGVEGMDALLKQFDPGLEIEALAAAS